MREAYLSGGSDSPAETTTEDATTPTAQSGPSAPVFIFESVTLTEEGTLQLVGMRYFSEATDSFTIGRSRAPHPDLLKELRRLTLHMALLTESVSDLDLYPPAPFLPLGPDMPEGIDLERLPASVAARNALRDAVESGEAFLHPKLEPFRCTSVKWKSKGIVLSGQRKSRYRFNKDLKIETPTTMLLGGLDDDLNPDADDYPFFEELRNTLDALRAELVAYMGGKYGTGGEQLELFGKEPEPEGEPSPEAELLAQVDEMLHAHQLRKDALNASIDEAGGPDLFTDSESLGRIHNPAPTKRKANRTGDFTTRIASDGTIVRRIPGANKERKGGQSE